MKKTLSKKKRRRRFIRNVIFAILSLVLLVAFIYLSPKIKLVMRLSGEAKKLAAKSTVNTFKETQTTIIYDANGNELCTMRDAKDMYYVEFGRIPKTLADAFVVMEDKDYYSHSGIDYKAVIRALIANKKSNAIIQGASTITQQLARNIFLNQDVTWERKIEEMFLARELEKKYSKEQILEFYMNNIYFGNGYYGVQAAAKGYFQKDVSELTLSEQAFIAAIPNNPTRYNPWTEYDNVIGRKDRILKALYEDDRINSTEYYKALEEDINVSKRAIVTRNNSVETYARHCATESLMRATGFIMMNNFKTDEQYEAYQEAYERNYTVCQQMLFSGGYKIYTSIDMNAQDALQNTIDSNLTNHTEISDEGIYELQASAVCIDNSTGNVVAIVGSRGQELEGYTLNRAYQSFRQPGSSIKPLIVYLPYLQVGNNPDTEVVDEKIPNGPNNADGVFSGVMSLRTAVMLSKNTVAWKIYQEIKPRVGIGFIINQGFKKVWMDRDYNACALGGFSYGVSAEEMAGAYATIENKGEYRYATCIVKICDAGGRVVVDTSKRGVRVYDADASLMMTDILQSVVEEGTGLGAKPDNVIVAGKTGTTNSNKDVWFCGFSRYYTTAIWVGFDYPKTVSGVNTKNIFKEYMEILHNGLKPVEFEEYQLKYEASNRPTQKATIEATTEATTAETETETIDPDVVRDPDVMHETTATEITQPETDAHGGNNGDVDTPAAGGDNGDVDTPAQGGSGWDDDRPAPGGNNGDVDTPAQGGTNGDSDTPAPVTDDIIVPGIIY